MHHVVLERWSRLSSPLHARDARVKVAALLVFLIAVATTPNQLPPVQAAAVWIGYALLVVVAGATARLPLGGLFARAAVVLPFSAAFAAFSYLAGDSQRAAALLVKSYLSAAGGMLLVGTTPLPNLMSGLESLGLPRLLALVIQFMYRYVFVLSEQAQHMRMAAQCRSSRGRPGFGAAAGTLAVLFARSLARAEAIHRAMLARGFTGQFPMSRSAHVAAADFLFLATAVVLALALRVAAGWTPQ